MNSPRIPTGAWLVLGMVVSLVCCIGGLVKAL